VRQKGETNLTFNPSYIFRSRHGVYYLRYPIPIEHHPLGKRDYIKLSLKTYIKKEALNLVNMIRYLDSSSIGRFYNMYGGLTYKEYKEKLTGLFREALEVRKSKLDEQGFFSDDSITLTPDWFYKDNDGDISTSILIEENYKSLCERANLPYIPEDEEGRKKVSQLYNALCLEMNKELLNYNNNLKMPSLTQRQVMQDNVTDTPSLKPLSDYSVEDVIEKHWNENSPNWKPQTIKSYTTYKNFFLTCIDAQTSSCAFNIEHARTIRNKIGERTIATKTKNEYLTYYRQVFLWAYNNGYTDKEYFQGMKFKGNAGDKKMREYKPHELTLIYKSLQEQKNKIKPHYYWVTMLGMYTGARQSELTQLYKDNFKQDKNGIWRIEISERFENQSVKSEAGHRYIPIHPELIKLGLLDYVNQFKDGTHIFPLLRYSPRSGDYSKNVSRWFNQKFLVDIGLKEASLDFHSFRRSITTILHQKNVDSHIVTALIGHSKEGITQHYNTGGYTSAQLKEAIDKFEF